jgi:hypothetical protein
MSRAVPLLLLSLAICTAALEPAPAADKANIAALDLDPRGGLGDEEILAISDRLRGELIATGRFTVVEREQMDAILKEQGFQQTGACAEASCIVEVGQLLAVHKMVGGSIGRVGKVFSVNLKVIDVATGTIERQIADDFRCSKEQLVSFYIRQVARRMAGLEQERRPVTSRWFFWAPMGVVAVGAGVAIAVLAHDDAPGTGGDLRSIPLDGSYQ